MSENILRLIYRNLGSLTEEENYQLLMRLWDELTEEQQQDFKDSLEGR